MGSPNQIIPPVGGSVRDQNVYQFISFVYGVRNALIKLPAVGVVIAHDKSMKISIELTDAMRMAIPSPKMNVLVEDVTKGIAYVTSAGIRVRVLHVRIPKALWHIYNKGETVKVFITPLSTKG